LTDSNFLDQLISRWRRGVTISEDDVHAFTALPWIQKTFGRDAYVVREGERTTSCCLLLQGFAFRQKLVSDGARQIISIHIPGEFVDLQNAMLTIADHNVQCLTRCAVAFVPREALADLMASRPNIGRAVWMDSLIDSSVFREWVVNVGRRDAKTRIAHLLCELAARLTASGGDRETIVDFPMTQEQLADATGLTAVHTNRTLQHLRKAGLISLSSNRLTILDWDALAEAGDFNERYLHHAL
jgi:CRP-like cAMP-binding protein